MLRFKDCFFNNARSRKRRSLLVWILALSCLCAGSGIAHGAVLCIEEDGHVEMEASQHGLCGSPLGTVAGDNHCGSCVDIPIYTSVFGDIAFNAKQACLQTDIPALSPLLTASLVETAPCETGVLRPDGSFQTNGFTASLRTVVLLI